MGKADHKQSKLSFDAVKKSVSPGRPRKDSVSEPLLDDDPVQSSSDEAMFMDLKQSLTTINSKTDQLIDRMNRLRKKVDDHDTKLDQLDCLTSDMDVEQQIYSERLLQM
ncbi:hypothetical protein NDU88_005682 [Pleurodeles waltl]|uniref:Uncharacterized protein n=1 Tax=Pleurodeles waltl TaxID=8319 RepID=A0AAV7WCJ5_PLEWA|nr:hypothetical protein NDU88_005682 [Pleurodeles waltl]